MRGDTGTGTLGNEWVVETESGRVAGFGADVRTFFAIPFAAPPVGALRWRPPRPPKPWTGVLAEKAFGADCPQLSGVGVNSLAERMDEDCLALNIWTPARAPGENLPVVVWIFGGGFFAGSPASPLSDYSYLAREGVVVVAVNHRVGLLGFLAHPGLTQESEHKSSGNYGLLDTISALAWVKRNIAAFGGDPGRVTVFGSSSGSATISLLLTSPLARGHFHQTIQQSPGAFRPLCSLEQAEEFGLRLGSDVQVLREMTTQDILSKSGLFVPKMRGLTTPRVLRPIHDGWVLPDDERTAYGNGSLMALPTIVGTNVDEGTMLTASWTIKTQQQFDTLIEESFGKFAQEAKRLYAPKSCSEADIREAVAFLFGDTQFTMGGRSVARGLNSAGAPVYRYLFAKQRPDGCAPDHGSEMPYTYGTFDAYSKMFFPSKSYAWEDRLLSKKIRDAWVRFAATGNPNGGHLPEWPSLRSDPEAYLVLNKPIVVAGGWRDKQLDFLDRYFGSAKNNN